jgi:hypothetical protein
LAFSARWYFFDAAEDIRGKDRRQAPDGPCEPRLVFGKCFIVRANSELKQGMAGITGPSFVLASICQTAIGS